MDFSTFELHPRIAAGVRAQGYDTPTPIQAQAIPPALEGADILGLAQTGTGKTAAFALPILDYLIDGPRTRVRALVIAPTRELTHQIHTAFSALGAKTGLRSVPIYGGVNINPQIRRLQGGAEIVVACPGRLLDHVQQGTAELADVEVLVLDEADRLFDMGFLPDIRRIITRLPADRQTLLFSATMPPDIRRLATEILSDPVTVEVDRARPAETVAHAIYPVAEGEKGEALVQILDGLETESVLVFTRTKRRAKRVAAGLVSAGFDAHLSAGQPLAASPPGGTGWLSERQVSDPGRNGHRGAGDRRLVDLARHQLRHARYGRRLYPPHRPHGPRRADRRRLHLGHSRRRRRGARDRADDGRPLGAARTGRVAIVTGTRPRGRGAGAAPGAPAAARGPPRKERCFGATSSPAPAPRRAE